MRYSSNFTLSKRVQSVLILLLMICILAGPWKTMLEYLHTFQLLSATNCISKLWIIPKHVMLMMEIGVPEFNSLFSYIYRIVKGFSSSTVWIQWIGECRQRQGGEGQWELSKKTCSVKMPDPSLGKFWLSNQSIHLYYTDSFDIKPCNNGTYTPGSNEGCYYCDWLHVR